MINKVDIGYLITHLFKSDKHLWDALKTLVTSNNETIDAINNFVTTPVSSSLPRVYTLVKNYTLAVDSDACPRIEILSSQVCTYFKATLKDPCVVSLNDGINIDIYQNGELWTSIHFNSGETEQTIDLTTVGSIDKANLFWRVDITQVGDLFPGADLTITIG